MLSKIKDKIQDFCDDRCYVTDQYSYEDINGAKERMIELYHNKNLDSFTALIACESLSYLIQAKKRRAVAQVLWRSILYFFLGVLLAYFI